MHIPDGILSLPVTGATTLVSTTGVWIALRQLGTSIPRRRIPLMGVSAAFVFAAQMINFPVVAGTSGHLIGSVLACVLLGPCAAVVVMTAVLFVQCLLFADGGLLALGANVANMALAAVLVGSAVVALIRRLLPGPRGLLVAAAFAAWCSTIAASMCCAAELAWAGVSEWRLLFPAMAGIHLLIGLGEAVITTLVLAAILKTRPELVPGLTRQPAAARTGLIAAYGFAATVGLLLFAVPFATSAPDGLEHVGAQLGFSPLLDGVPTVPSPMSDYRAPGVSSAVVATSVAGVAGTVVVFALACGLAAALTPKSAADQSHRRGPQSA